VKYISICSGIESASVAWSALGWENVPGVLSSNGGRDFGAFLGMLGQLGYGFASRVLDAQFVRVESHRRAVPQRRRRVFVVGYLGDWRRAASVLFESESLCRYTPPSRKAGERVAPSVTSGPPFSRTGNDRVEAEAMIPVAACAGTLGHNGKAAGSMTQQDAENGMAVINQGFHTTGARFWKGGEVSGTLRAQEGDSHEKLFCFNPRKNSIPRNHIERNGSVRRLTPLECSRLQGFPDDWARIPWRGKGAESCPDGPQYKAYGNSMAGNVMRWLGERIDKENEL
jgi:DNA (cytosine-5)-methyltransferase 1